MPVRNPIPVRKSTPALLLAAVLALLFIPADPASADVPPPGDPHITLVADRDAISVDDVVTVTVQAEGLVDAYGFELELEFDPSLLTWVDDGETLPPGGFGTATEENGTVTVVGTRLGTSPGLAGTQTLASFRMSAAHAGDAAVRLTAGTLVDSQGAATTIDTSAAGLSVTITDPGDTTGAGAAANADASGSGGGGSSPGAGGSVGGSGDASAGAADLAGTGGDAAQGAVLAIGAVLVLAIGAALVARQRKARR